MNWLEYTVLTTTGASDMISNLLTVSYTHLDVYKRQVYEQSQAHPAYHSLLFRLFICLLYTSQ